MTLLLIYHRQTVLNNTIQMLVASYICRAVQVHLFIFAFRDSLRAKHDNTLHSFIEVYHKMNFCTYKIYEFFWALTQSLCFIPSNQAYIYACNPYFFHYKADHYFLGFIVLYIRSGFLLDTTMQWSAFLVNKYWIIQKILNALLLCACHDYLYIGAKIAM